MAIWQSESQLLNSQSLRRSEILDEAHKEGGSMSAMLSHALHAAAAAIGR